MSESLFDILSRKDFDEPAEVAAIKKYINVHFQVTAEVLLRGHDIIVTLPSAALANTMRFHLPQLKQAAKTDKRLVLRAK